jgi:hypothetical protein
VFPEQVDGPQGVVFGANTQAPVASQAVAPHSVPIGVQAAAQQFPVPAMPQMPDVH